MTETTAELGFVHRFEVGTEGERTLLLLHGTGGDESDLLPLAQAVAPGWSVLSPRGKVLEQGMPRFFRRIREGVFDLEDVAHRADELAEFVSAARTQYGLGRPIALGFSNGANIAAAVMLRHPDALAGAALIRAQRTIEGDPSPDLSGTHVLVLSGATDPLIPVVEAQTLVAQLANAGAAVDHEVVPAGHNLTQTDLDLLKQWLDARAAGQQD